MVFAASGVPAPWNPRGRAKRTYNRNSPKEPPLNSVARVTEIAARSPKSFEDALRIGVARATKTLRGVTSAWIKEQKVEIKNGKITSYQVNMLVTFVID